ncbi:MAG: hypothetical protein LBH59_02530 [Planctomycetaceae bacterium]|jgi:hypothetical protein|nr:hypothetical protein [Planctomycetaceae bacterium]
MYKIKEKLSVALGQLNELRARFAPLGERVELLNKKVDLISQSVAELVNEMVEVKTIANDSANAFDSIVGVLVEVEAESDQICRNVEENEVLRESMTSMFGEAFNVVSKFIDTAKHIGIIDDNRAVQILAGKSEISATENLTTEITDTDTNTNIIQTIPEPTIENAIEDVESAFDDVIKTELESTENTLPNEINNAISPNDVVDNEVDLTAKEIASQLDLTPLQFDSQSEVVTDKSTNNNESETDTEESLEAILDDISKPISTV